MTSSLDFCHLSVKLEDVQETSQIMYHSKGLDESYQKNVSFIKFE